MNRFIIFTAWLALAAPAHAEPVSTRRLSGHWFELAPGSLAEIPAGKIEERSVLVEGKEYPGVRLARESKVVYRDHRVCDPFVDAYGDYWKDGVPELSVAVEGANLVLRSQGLPNHPTAEFPNSGNPNPILTQEFTFYLPLEPKKAARVTTLPMGPVAVAVNGVVFFNPFEAGGMNAVQGYSEVWLDACCGHPQQQGVYHYHKYPTCVKSPFKDHPAEHSPLIGLAWDGFPIYGPYEGDSVMARDLKGAAALDDCNGHEDAVRGYHYHVTPDRFPYILGGYRGEPEAANSFALNRAGTGAIQDNSRGVNERLGAAIVSVTPVVLKAGETQAIVIKLDPAKLTLDVPGPPGERPRREGPRLPADAVPRLIQIGPYVATDIERKGNEIRAKLTLPADANPVSYDLHLQFSGGEPTPSFKKNSAVRIGP